MILWRGRLSFRQYIPNKRHKYGIKLYELTTDNGYILNIIIYVGKGTLENQNDSHATSVVKQLLQDYLGKGYILYVDNFYTSVSLAEYLLSEMTGMVGTLRANRRGTPKNLMNAKLKEGEAIWKRKGGVVVSKWKDKREVRMISTCHKHEMVKIKTRRGSEKLKLKCILDYNAHMSGVDRADQMMSYYLKNYKMVSNNIFSSHRHLFVECFFLYKKRRRTKTLLEFRDDVLMELLDPQLSPKPPMAIDFQSHHFQAENVGTKNAMRRCRWCSKHNIRKRSKYHCPLCEKQPGLCVVPCFRGLLHYYAF
nr:unnamed protein product [Callosobruchus analis]